MPGLRVCALILPDLIKNTFLEYKEWTDTYTSILSQGSLAVYLGSGMFDKYQDSIRRLYMNRMGVLQETVRENPAPGLEWNIPDSGFFACVKLKRIRLLTKYSQCCLKTTYASWTPANFS